jgi:hypothetical protein
MVERQVWPGLGASFQELGETPQQQQQHHQLNHSVDAAVCIAVTLCACVQLNSLYTLT